ncbi:MAG TPA: type 4a pilus biogenesis protein PilO [Acidobacteriota bacterium]|jgi:Tfp pilus assembly protein PilO
MIDLDLLQTLWQERRRWILPLALLLVINLALIFFWTLPLRARIATVESQRARSLNQLEQRREELDQIRADIRKLVRVKDHSRTFYQQVLATKQARMTEMLGELESLAGDFNIPLESVVFSENEPREGRGLIHFTIKLPLTGDYNSLREFLARVENSSSFFIIDGIRLAESERSAGSNLNLAIELSTYFTQPAQEEGAT